MKPFIPTYLSRFFLKNEDISLHNHITVIEIRKLILMHFYYLIYYTP